MLGGSALLVESINIYSLFGSTVYYVALFGAIIIMAGGPLIQAFALGYIFAKKNLMKARMYPRHVGTKNVWWKRSRSWLIDSVVEGVPRFRTVMYLEKPRYNHPEYGPQSFIFVDHNYDFNIRLDPHQESAAVAGVRITHPQCDFAILIEQDEPEVLDWKKIPVYDMFWAGKDYGILHGDILPEQLESPGLEEAPTVT